MTDRLIRIQMLVESKLRQSKFTRIVLLVAGCLLVAAAFGHLIRFALHWLQGYSMNLWYLLLQAWVLGLASHLISLGIRKAPVETTQGNKALRIGWKRVLAGTFLLISCSYNLLHPTPPSSWITLDPSDKGVRMWTNITTIALLLLGVRFVFLGVWRGSSGPQKQTHHPKDNAD